MELLSNLSGETPGRNLFTASKWKRVREHDGVTSTMKHLLKVWLHRILKLTFYKQKYVLNIEEN